MYATEMYKREDTGITAAFITSITGVENLKRFQDRIGFTDREKQESLRKYLSKPLQ